MPGTVGADAHVSEPQSIRNRSEESVGGGATRREKGGREFSRLVMDRIYAKRIAPADLEVNREKTSAAAIERALAWTNRDGDLEPGASCDAIVDGISRK